MKGKRRKEGGGRCYEEREEGRGKEEKDEKGKKKEGRKGTC